MKLRQIVIILILSVLLVSMVSCSKNEQNAPTSTDKVSDSVIAVTPQPEPEFEGTSEILDTVTDDMFMEYDNQILSGSQVSTAVYSFQGKSVAVLVATRMVMDGTTAYNTPDGNITTDTPTVGASGLTEVINTAGESMSDKMTFINYGAVLKGSKGEAMIKFDGNCFIAKDGLDIDGDKYITNTVLDSIASPGAAENIADYLQMQAYLIKDTKGEIIGVAFYSI